MRVLSVLFRIIRWLRRISEPCATVGHWLQLLLGLLRKILIFQLKPAISHDPHSKCCIDPSVNASSFSVVDPTPYHTAEGHAPTQFHYSLAVPIVPESQYSTSFQVQDPNNVAECAACTGDGFDSTTGSPLPSKSLAIDVHRTLPEPQPHVGHPSTSSSSSWWMPEPMLANEIRRYDRGNMVKSAEKRITIPAGEKEFRCLPSKTPCPEPWLQMTHPEGALYFYHPHRRIFTDADIRMGDNRERIESYADALLQRVEARYPNIVTADAELALELFDHNIKEGKERSCKYYYVDHQKRVLFWAHNFAPEVENMGNVKSVSDLSHVRYMIEAEYWTHCELFPNRRPLPKTIVDELKETTLHANTEMITSDISLSPYDKEDLSVIYSLLDNIQADQEAFRPHSVWVTARLMRQFSTSYPVSEVLISLMRSTAKVKFVNWCGQPTARLDADRSIYEQGTSQQRTSLLLRMFNWLLFGSPQAHLNSIRRIWVDEIVVQPRWKNFIFILNDEWNRFTIFSTVVLAVDVSFLAVPGVNPNTSPSLATIAVYLSTICAVGSLLVSVILSGQMNNESHDSAEAVANLMTRMTNTMLKRDCLAIVHSLPFALLIWGMIFFSLALSYLIFQSNNLVTFLTVGPGWVIVSLFTIWPVVMHLCSRKNTKDGSVDVEETSMTDSFSSSSIDFHADAV
ncbi:hypothetical protein PAXRUDRAFT_469427 [Paxillus rubicundulus Ve08.2h10]|uniref:Uncharacterized protein n=1 Tax=Paxillus rubicundulus Ve08.2h10 TaxID=930991 RepID=A0A0D0E7M6_9AGAM|nr:hypothetical protein PAXRUDRAFT_469427 [Paxillus rubicundulus Ve08.2h10]